MYEPNATLARPSGLSLASLPLAIVQTPCLQWLENSASDLRLVSQAVRAEEIYKLLQNRFSTWEEEQARRGAAATYRGW